MAYTEERLNAPDGSALTWIFDHILRYPGTYEIPLRTMYALNSNPTRQPSPGTCCSPETAFARRPTSPKSSAAADLRAQLTQQISRLPSQPCSLPPSFITSFLRRCFAPQLEDVDFPQALTGLDYLRDFEIRRKKEVVAALQRLGLEQGDLREPSELAKKYPGVLTWLESINIKGRKVEALYTQIYIGLRRWALINEMLLEPFNRANCIAMLNTLFPPVTEATVTPTSQLTPQILKSQRDGFFRYISAFETNGRQILDKVIAQGAPEGESTGWPLVRDALDKYLRTANEIIDECAMAHGQASFDEVIDSPPRGHKGRKVDSGISFGSSDKIPAPSITSSTISDYITEKPLPPSPKGTHTSKTGGSTLERLARELRKLGDSGKVKGLKKMKSSSTLGIRPETPSVDEESFFEIDEQKRKRLIWEATTRKRSHMKQSSGSSRFD
ncbi:hypothetical protein P175DRAFT_0528690 [Aspergillus ochraceoroseus IBT 24754]|uniref:Uncharacterized protein n=3 Tax=Aspergillus subgen. Nidulantes TaxID=2720870 RepID=A0A0F8U7B8_9EURO|nr:uncharacterized protein P175DRAFT_0528690 [Aspergillus ochraceoroseus IBT 24754]KKK15493.1 hypothetical protein ARAM_006212 [Aspergillus rambellii]KKK21366.1 hypothetical protein AOCH_002059 [Aspergillus ochraceoroseus]PTU25159.1 hypothetical protein P175DRAFT_0528690 [Aspergillus ochraceoroseus IBT 24754]